MAKRCAFVVAMATIMMATPPPAAAAETCAEEAALLRTHLEVEERRTRRWNTAWLVTYSSVVVVQLTVAAVEYKPWGTFDQAFRDSMIVGGTKASLGVGVRLFLPLRVRSLPTASADACADLAALRQLVADGGRRERRSFFLNHLGGLAVNLTGALFLWDRHDLETAALSFGTGVAAGILAAYTQPRRSWHLWRARRATWTAGAAPIPGGVGFGFVGSW